MRIGVVGIGTVGTAVADGFEYLGYEVRRYDPDKGHKDNIDTDIVFVCIYDWRDLRDVVADHSDQVVVIKTTSPPGTTDKLIEEFGKNIVYNPEFLCEKTAKIDFLHQDKAVVGCRDLRTGSKVIDLYRDIASTYILTTPVEAEIAKLALNTFYATKVTQANEIADICCQHDCDYEAVRAIMEADQYVHPNHLDVYYGDYRGFGGKCLPKDVQLFITSGRRYIPELASTVQKLNRRRLDAQGRDDYVQRFALYPEDD